MLSRPGLLATIPLFSAMDDEERLAVAAIMDEVSFAPNHVIFRASETGGAFYIITHGQVELSVVDDDGVKLVVDTLDAGEVCGELSLLDGGNRAFTAITLRPTSALVLERDEFLSLLRSRPDTALDVMQVLVHRIRRTDGLLRRRVSRNPNEAIEEHESLGDRVADGVARFGGSWAFISLFGLFLVVWVLINTVLIFYNRGRQPFDPYPFILLNLFLSMIAAIQAPVIMMSQNRQDARDRIRAELDYQVNLKAELEIAELRRTVDALSEELLRRLPSRGAEDGAPAHPARVYQAEKGPSPEGNGPV